MRDLVKLTMKMMLQWGAHEGFKGSTRPMMMVLSSLNLNLLKVVKLSHNLLKVVKLSHNLLKAEKADRKAKRQAPKPPTRPVAERPPKIPRPPRTHIRTKHDDFYNRVDAETADRKARLQAAKNAYVDKTLAAQGKVIREMHKAGRSNSEIADELDIPPTAVLAELNAPSDNEDEPSRRPTQRTREYNYALFLYLHLYAQGYNMTDITKILKEFGIDRSHHSWSHLVITSRKKFGGDLKEALKFYAERAFGSLSEAQRAARRIMQDHKVVDSFKTRSDLIVKQPEPNYPSTSRLDDDPPPIPKKVTPKVPFKRHDRSGPSKRKGKGATEKSMTPEDDPDDLKAANKKIKPMEEREEEKKGSAKNLGVKLVLLDALLPDHLPRRLSKNLRNVRGMGNRRRALYRGSGRKSGADPGFSGFRRLPI